MNFGQAKSLTVAPSLRDGFLLANPCNQNKVGPW